MIRNLAELFLRLPYNDKKRKKRTSIIAKNLIS